MRHVGTPIGNLRSWWQRTFRDGRESEKRCAPRTPFSGWVEITSGTGDSSRGLARDLSMRGMGTIIFAEFALGERVRIKYTHPAAADRVLELSRHATVRSRYGSRYGFEFEKPIEFWSFAVSQHR